MLVSNILVRDSKTYVKFKGNPGYSYTKIQYNLSGEKVKGKALL